MSEEIISLPIEKLAGLGEGVGLYKDQKIFVPYTLAGDVVRAKLTAKGTGYADHAVLEEIITPGTGRVVPVCKHFTRCGGCSLQHLERAQYIRFKQQMASEAVRKAGFDPITVKPIIALPAATRRRGEFKVKNGKLGYYEARSHTLVAIEECKVLEAELEKLVLQLSAHVVNIPNLTSVQINGVDDGYDILLECKEDALFELSSFLSVKRISVRVGSKLRTLPGAEPVTVTLGKVAVEIPPGAFMQASRESQALMIKLVLEGVGSSKRVADLFAGMGTYSFPLSEKAEVTAIEGDSDMVKALYKTAEKYGLGKQLKAEKRDLFHQPLSPKALKAFDAVVINPPRTGAKAQSEALAKSDVNKVVMVSCNPATFTRDARLLKEGGYTLTTLTPIDQFVYSSHLELVAEFTR